MVTHPDAFSALLSALVALLIALLAALLALGARRLRRLRRGHGHALLLARLRLHALAHLRLRDLAHLRLYLLHLRPRRLPFLAPFDGRSH